MSRVHVKAALSATGRLCAEAGIPFTLRRVSRDEVSGADELLLSSAELVLTGIRYGLI